MPLLNLFHRHRGGTILIAILARVICRARGFIADSLS